MSVAQGMGAHQQGSGIICLRLREMLGCSYFVCPPDMLSHWCSDSTKEAQVYLPLVPGMNHLQLALGLWTQPAALAWQLDDYPWHFTETSRPLANLVAQASQTGCGLANKATPDFQSGV